MNVTIQAQDIPAETLTAGRFAIGAAGGGGRQGMPPGSIYLYLFLEAVPSQGRLLSPSGALR